ncbi:MAG: alpha-glucosidase [Bacteroidales bacterium]|nr:alpha-glucosidase [Bacteroidales bacterium]
MGNKETKDWLWWKHGVIYHIFPLSFYDSDGDGFGDLQGIVQKLDYLSELGIDAIWLSPVYQSPMIDFGYDVSDYRKIDPVFGNMDDFRHLLQECHNRGIRLIMDMVMNHTSDQHPWFVDSKSSKDNPKREWYIWKEPRKGRRPNNWKSAYGGSAWELEKTTGQYYLHTFFKEQPDLNWRNKELRKAFMEEFKFWLDMGVDGFRLDVINMIVKDKKFRNNPGLLMGLLGRWKWHTRNQPKSYKIVRQLRKMMDQYEERMMVGEVYTLPPGDSELAGSYLEDGTSAIHLAFDFSLMFKPWSAHKYYRAIEKWYASIPMKGWPCHVFSNHDLRRLISRLGSGENRYHRARVAAMLLLTLKGTPFIYYGEEIGMQNTPIKYQQIKDRLGKKFWPVYKGRDKARTPMQWDAGEFAGFSRVVPWLPVNPDRGKINVADQKNNRDSLYKFYQTLLQLRKRYEALHSGNWVPLVRGEKGAIVYLRIAHNQKLIVLLNFLSRKNYVSIEGGFISKVLLSTHRFNNEHIEATDLQLKPFEATLLEDMHDQKV